MLESDLRALFNRQASGDLPPARISFPAIRRIARIRRRWQRSAIIASPVLAAGAVFAVAFTAVAPLGHSGTPRPAPISGAAPKNFNPLRPYAAVGWLPARERIATTSVTQANVLIVWGNPPGQLVAFSRGHCKTSGQLLTCPSAIAGDPPQLRQSLVRSAGLVHGRSAYWSPKGMVLSVASSVSAYRQHINIKLRDGSLIWQYAPGGWANVQALTLPAALKIARTARFGPAVAPRIKWPMQLTAAPADWRVSGTNAKQSKHGELYGQGLGFTSDGPGLDFRRSSGKSACTQVLGELGATQVARQTVNGYLAETFHANAVHPPDWQLCAPDADGLQVSIEGASHGDGPASLVRLFGQLRLLGPDPAKWTTDPIAG